MGDPLVLPKPQCVKLEVVLRLFALSDDPCAQQLSVGVLLLALTRMSVPLHAAAEALLGRGERNHN